MQKHYSLLKNLCLLLSCVFPFFLQADYWTSWTEDPANPVYSPLPNRSYYPSVQYDKDQFSGHGVSVYYKMWSDSPSIALSISNDGTTWTTVGVVGGLTNPRHGVVLYDADSFGEGDGYYYKIWYWDSSYSTSINGFRHAKSLDGLTWVEDNVCLQNPASPLVFGSYGSSYFYNFFGPSTVIYNKDATNVPGSPMTYRYVVYYIGGAGGNPPGQWDNTCLAYSANGIEWTRYGSSPVLLPTGNTADWDGFFSTSGSVIKTQNSYHMWYSGSPVGGDDIKGIGYASSTDGINWVRSPTNPIFYVTDPGESWRNVRTYACSVLFDPEYFGEPADNKVLKMWFSGKSTPGVYSVGYAAANFITNAAVSTVTASPSTVSANGTSTSIITVTLKATEGQPLVGSTVTLTPNLGSSVISPLSGVSDAMGQVIFTVKDSVVETVTYTATDTTNNVVITEQATVFFVQQPAPPSNLTGKQKKNDFGVVYELFNLLKWSASSNPGIEGYYIYRDGVRIAFVGPLTFKYEDHNQKKRATTVYSVSSVLGGIESTLVSVTIK